MRTKFTKRQLLDQFGSRNETARALGCTPAMISMLPAKLPRKKSDEILGILVRTGAPGYKLQEVDQ